MLVLPGRACGVQHAPMLPCTLGNVVMLAPSDGGIVEMP